MKRAVPLILLLGSAGLLVPVLSVCGESPTRSGCKAQYASGGCCDKPCSTAAVSCSPPNCCAKTPAKCGTIVEELTAILNETKSAETFLVTTIVLGRLGPEAKPALPAIIRNAERLELLEDMFDTGTSADNSSRAAQGKIGNALEMILDKKAWAKGRIGPDLPPGWYYPGTSAPAYAPPCPVPAATWNAPVATPTLGVRPSGSPLVAQPIQATSEDDTRIKPMPPSPTPGEH